jgi:hypothetical protein
MKKKTCTGDVHNKRFRKWIKEKRKGDNLRDVFTLHVTTTT